MTEIFKKNFRSTPSILKWEENQVNKTLIFLISQQFSSPSKAGYSCPRCRQGTAPSDVRAVSQQRLMRVVHHRGFLKSQQEIIHIFAAILRCHNAMEFLLTLKVPDSGKFLNKLFSRMPLVYPRIISTHPPFSPNKIRILLVWNIYGSNTYYCNWIIIKNRTA